MCVHEVRGLQRGNNEHPEWSGVVCFVEPWEMNGNSSFRMGGMKERKENNLTARCTLSRDKIEISVYMGKSY